jgi:hypothetical protein
MDGKNYIKRPPLDVQREFSNCRLETQVLIKAYELVVPVIRRQINTEYGETQTVYGQIAQRA